MITRLALWWLGDYMNIVLDQKRDMMTHLLSSQIEDMKKKYADPAKTIAELEERRLRAEQRLAHAQQMKLKEEKMFKARIKELEERCSKCLRG